MQYSSLESCQQHHNAVGGIHSSSAGYVFFCVVPCCAVLCYAVFVLYL